MDESTPQDLKDEVTITFPCDYPIKVILDNDPVEVQKVQEIARKFDPSLKDKIELNPSKKGTYVSVRLSFWATGTPQLDSLFTELKTLPSVRMVL